MYVQFLEIVLFIQTCYILVIHDQTSSRVASKQTSKIIASLVCTFIIYQKMCTFCTSFAWFWKKLFFRNVRYTHQCTICTHLHYLGLYEQQDKQQTENKTCYHEPITLLYLFVFLYKVCPMQLVTQRHASQPVTQFTKMTPKMKLKTINNKNSYITSVCVSNA
jgi:hypothetical protein